MYRDKRIDDAPTRVLSLALPEIQWRALMDIEPEPIAWLRQQIRERLDEAGGGDESRPVQVRTAS